MAVIEVGSSTDRSARREKSVDLVPLSDAAIRLVAVLRDTSVAVDDPTDVELIHDLRIEASVSVPDLVITGVTGHAEQQPYDRCAFTAAPIARLKGLSLSRGYRRNVLEIMGGTRGCSHFLTLALDLSAAHVLTVYLQMRTRTEHTAANRADGTWARTGLDVAPGLMNACYSLAADSPVQQLALRRAPD
ncbi:DUF2889 domain-containing protein [Pseudonocardia sp. GCM10023141]|uniref:DUF2889 domain-containing protein n=1 Tax=Pseudonocardia sp. GCM10023141 TaxID=3252653 RepID=UPI003610BBDA